MVCHNRNDPFRLNLTVNAPDMRMYIDVRNIISDDDSLQEGVLPALKEYNLAQFMAVDVPGTDHQVCYAHSFGGRWSFISFSRL